MVSSKELEAHQQYLAEVPREFNQRRLKTYRLKDDVFDAVFPVICNENLFVVPSESKRFMHPLEPLSLADLKNWFGTPNALAKRQQSTVRQVSGSIDCCGREARINFKNLPRKKSFDYGKLEPEQQRSVKQAATNLLYSYVDDEQLNRPEIAGVVNYMLERTVRTNPQVLVAPNLIVCPDDKVEFKNIPTLLFNNILIYGNGEMASKSPLSIDAYQIQHINA